jgi:hypothetical protein
MNAGIGSAGGSCDYATAHQPLQRPLELSLHGALGGLHLPPGKRMACVLENGIGGQVMHGRQGRRHALGRQEAAVLHEAALLASREY